MSAIDQLLREPAAQAIGWALLHFIWQGTLVAALTAMVLTFFRNGAADIRYVVATIGLSVMLTLPAVTAVQLLRADVNHDFRLTDHDFRLKAEATTVPAAATGPVASGFSRKKVSVATATEMASATSSSRFVNDVGIEAWLPMLVFAWICGVVVLSLRLASGWLWVQRMKSHGTAAVEDGWDLIASRLSRRLHIGRPVRLLQSTLVDVPTVIGWLRPVILLPASALSGLTPHQLEAILAHELAHIRRHDYLVNLLQAVVETLLFYHPAVWWLSRRIRAERENCCDDLAVSLCGDPIVYAQALTELEGLRGPSHRFVMAADGGSLVQRVRRLLGVPTHAGRAPGWLAGSASVLVLLGVAVGAAGTDAFQTSQSTAPPPASSQERHNDATTEQLRDEARATTAAAQRIAQQADVLRMAAEAAKALQDATHQATTAVLAGQTLAARASALDETARVMAAEADSKLTAAKALEPVITGLAFAASQTTGTFSWSHNGEKVEIRYDGEVEFTDDDTDVKRLTPGGSLRIRDGGMMTSLLGGHTAEFIADNSGNITRRFWVGSSERPFDPEGRKWLASVLPRFIRQSGIGASARVARILKSKGPAGVLAEIALIDGSWGKRKYFSELLKTGSLDAATIRQVLEQAGREIDSDFELASLLVENSDRLLVDDTTAQAYFEAARSIQSDFELRRVLSSAVKRRLSPSVLASLLTTSRNIDSDFEEASLLIDVAKLQSLDNTTRPAFFTALDTVESSFEHRRVLTALGTRSDLPQETVGAMLTSSASVSSDFEAASFLIQIAKQQPIEGSVRAPFFRAVDSINSAFERARVLKAVADRSDASPDTILAVLQATKGVSSNFEAAQVLIAVASAHPVSGSGRDAYIDVAEKLGDFEQGRVLAALVKNERRK